MNNKNPLVSVVMPVYNSENFLKESIESILYQTYANFEFIIIDDFSSDNSWKIITRYSKEDNRIISLRNEKNLGVAKTRNIGIGKSRGLYIIQFDSDDVSFLDRIEKEVAFMEKNIDIGVLGTSWIEFKNNIKSNNNIFKKVIYGVLEGTAPIHQPSSIIRKKIYENFGMYNENYKNAEDTELWFKFYSKGVKFFNLDEPLLYYRINSNSLSNKNKLNQLILLNKVFIKGFFIYKIRYNIKGYLTFLDRYFYVIILLLKVDKIINKDKLKKLFQ